MATGRTKIKWWRVYIDGYDMSGFSRSIGPLEMVYDEVDMTAPMSDTVKGYLPNQGHVNTGTLNAVFDNTATTGLHALMITAGISRNVITAIGMRAIPAGGDPCFGGTFIDTAYQVTQDGGAVTATIPFAGWSVEKSANYVSPWGTLLHANAAETGVNSGTGYDNPTGASTAKGGYFMYHVLASSNPTHTATLSVDDAATNAGGSFAPLSGATSGSITVTAGVSGIIFLGNTATVRQFLRWQIALGTATSVTFVSAFFRAY
jgi:hypothetical protein